MINRIIICILAHWRYNYLTHFPGPTIAAYIVDSGINIMTASIAGTALRSILFNSKNDLFDDDAKSIRKHETFKAVAMCLIDYGSKGVSTKEVALICNISIYSARYYLLKLQDMNFANSDSLGKSHTWFLNNIGVCGV